MYTLHCPCVKPTLHATCGWMPTCLVEPSSDTAKFKSALAWKYPLAPPGNSLGSHHTHLTHHQNHFLEGTDSPTPSTTGTSFNSKQATSAPFGGQLAMNLSPC